jgi:TRAP-type transport system small permease protein
VSPAPGGRLARGYARFCAAESRIASALLVAMVVLILAGAVSRVFGHPLNWSTDAATAAFAWAGFLCADVAWRRNALMSIEFVTARLAAAPARWLRMANLFVIAVFLVYVIVLGLQLSWTSRVRTFQGIPGVSYSWVTLSMPVGASLLLLTTLLKLRDERAGRGRALGSAAEDVL